ncbi:DUF502 domain-containing protein [Cyclobacteriaceae bacterium]|nr:DUF502 domain-containing protein [Cyclobacteriaceae bacterium]
MLKTYFVRGLLFVTPIGVTALILLSIYEWIIEKIHDVQLQGITLTIITVSFLVGITLLGYLGSTFLIKPIGDQLEKLIAKIPFVSLIYSSIKDLSSAFMGDKKKFDIPVLVQMDDSGILKKPGFITRLSLSELGKEGLVAVYLPHSYNFSGNIFVTESKYVDRVDNVHSGEYMKFIVSGGVTGDLNIKKEEG